MEILYALLILLLVTRVFGEVAHRLGHPALVGELVAGIALGALFSASSELLPFLAGLREDRVFLALKDLGIFFLMLFGGVQLRASDLARVSVPSLLVATSGFLIPCAVGFALAWWWLPPSELKYAQSLLVATALSITAVPVSIRVLMDLGKLGSPVGLMIVAAAIIDDILSLVVLAFLLGILRTGTLPSAGGILELIGSIALFLVITVLLARFVAPRIGVLFRSLKTPEFEFTSLLLAALALAVLAELLHLHFILGAFCAGLLFERRSVGSTVYQEVSKRFSAVTLGFLAPVFFASVGMHLDIRAVTEVPLFLGLFVLVAVLTKLVGAGLPAWLLGFAPRDAAAIGIGMSARGAVELVIVDIALRAGVFDLPDPPPPIVANLFSSIVIMAVVTTLVTPILLARAFGRKDRGSA